MNVLKFPIVNCRCASERPPNGKYGALSVVITNHAFNVIGGKRNASASEKREGRYASFVR